MLRKEPGELHDMKLEREKISLLMKSLGFNHDIRSSHGDGTFGSYLDPGSNYGIDFYGLDSSYKPIFVPYVVYPPTSSIFSFESEYVEWEEFFDGISNSIKDKIIFHLNLFGG
jgi:hypothetical protein